MSKEIKEQETAETFETNAAQASVSTKETTAAELEFEPADDSPEADEADEGVVIHDADAEDALEAEQLRAMAQPAPDASMAAPPESYDAEEPHNVRSMAEMMAIIESLIFVAEEPLSVKALADVLREDRGWIETALEGLAEEFNARNGGLHLREVAGGWQFATRPEHHEHVRAFLRTRPSAKLSLASLETLAVIAYKQPITVPEILEIRGVQSPSAIKTLLDKRLIVAKGRKETIGRPMMYGTSKEFLLQFGLKDLTELPSIEDFEDLAGGM
ncbi:MAG TPA: SMC-Scp complex subunit ScpB [Pyrinomonadaceae bacterium]|jgi:segregation and condensation protein B